MKNNNGTKKTTTQTHLDLRPARRRRSAKPIDELAAAEHAVATAKPKRGRKTMAQVKAQLDAERAAMNDEQVESAGDSDLEIEVQRLRAQVAEQTIAIETAMERDSAREGLSSHVVELENQLTELRAERDAANAQVATLRAELEVVCGRVLELGAAKPTARRYDAHVRARAGQLAAATRARNAEAAR